MSVITNEIEAQAFELIRNRIGEVLADELANQAAISYDDYVADTVVYIDRFVPFSGEQVPAVNVMLARGTYGNETVLKSDGTYTYNIDCYTSAKSTTLKRGDSLAMTRLHKLLGLCRAILRDTRYRTLGFSNPFISNVTVGEIQIANPVDPNNTGSVVMGRITLIVRVPENVDSITPTVLGGYQTQVKLGQTDEGYIWSSDADPTPQPPSCPVGEVYNTNSLLLAEVPSGGSVVIPDQVAVNEYGDIIGTNAANEQIVIPNITVSNSDDSYTDEFQAGEDIELANVTHTQSDGTPVSYPGMKPFVCTPVASGISYRRTVPKQFTSYATYDSGWHLQNGTYVYSLNGPDQPQLQGENSATRDGTSNDFLKLAKNNAFGNKEIWTNDVGAQDFDSTGGATPNYRINHINGLGYYNPQNVDFWANLLNYANSFTVGGYSDWRLANELELLQMLTGLNIIISQRLANAISSITGLAVSGNVATSDTFNGATSFCVGYTIFGQTVTVSKTGSQADGILVRNHYI